MQENSIVKKSDSEALTNLKTMIAKFISDYKSLKQTPLVEDENNVLNGLNSIIKNIDNILKNSETFNVIDEYNHVIVNLLAIKPAKNKTTGIIFKTTIENTIILPLYDAMDRFIKMLEGNLEKFKKIEESEKEEQISKHNELIINEIKQEMLILKEKFNDAVNSAYNKGKEEGVYELKNELVRRAQKYLPEAFHHGFLMMLEGKEPPQPFIPTVPVETMPSSSVQIKTDEEEKEKAKKWMGENKFSVAEELTKNYKEMSNQEKLIAKFLIFQLMVHKNDKTVKEVIDDIVKLLETKSGITRDKFIKKFPRIANHLEQYLNMSDAISNNPLSENEIKVFFQLLSSDLYLKQDGTGANYFSAKFQELKTGHAEDPRLNESYEKNFLNKFNQADNKSGIHSGREKPEKPASESNKEFRTSLNNS